MFLRSIFLSSFFPLLFFGNCMRVAGMAGADEDEEATTTTTRTVMKGYCPVQDGSCDCPKKTASPFRGKDLEHLHEKVRCHLVNSPYHYLKLPEAQLLVESMEFDIEEEEVSVEPPEVKGKGKEGKGGKGKGKGKGHGPYGNQSAIVPRDARGVAYDPTMAAADRSRLFGIASAIADNLARAESAFAAAGRVAQGASNSMNQESENVANARREIEKIMRQL
jgi:hypothetical protein